MAALETAKPGTRLCVIGWGTAGVLHTHAYVVKRQTKTLTVAERTNRPGQRRFRTEDGRSVPRDSWGGTIAAITCQRKGA